jgi:glycosyltransferase involved in cell wall biosynthesis
MNSPDETIFRDRPAMGRVEQSVPTKRFVIMYHGSLVDRHGLDLAVAAIDMVRRHIPNIELRVYGKRTPYLDKVMASVERSGLDAIVRYHGAKNLEQIADAIGAADVGVIPNRRSVFTELNTPTRIFEYLSQSKPVIAPRAQGILDYFGPSDLVYFELGDVNDLAAKILYVYSEPEAVAASLARARHIYRNHCWDQERRRFLELASDLLIGRAQLTEPKLPPTRASEQGV